MYTYIHFDSTQRNRELYASSYEYETSMVCSNGNFKNKNSQYKLVKLTHLTLPYNSQTILQPIIYINFHSSTFNDTNITTINDVNSNINFVCIFNKIQNDSSGNPLWIHYKCSMEQNMRITFNSYFKIKIFTNSGLSLTNTDTLFSSPPNNLSQTFVTFRLKEC